MSLLDPLPPLILPTFPAKPEPKAEQPEPGDVWSQVRAHPPPPKNGLLSWDALEHPHLRKPVASSYATEQDTAVFDAIISHVDGGLGPTHSVSSSNLFHHITSLIIGCSSDMFLWSEATASFSVAYGGSSIHQLRIEGLDATASQSIINRFIHTGTRLRRLEQYVAGNTESSSQLAFYEFRHALKTAVARLKRQLNTPVLCPPTHLIQIWKFYAESATVLEAFANFCNMDPVAHPSPPYTRLPTTDVELLNLIFDKLDQHIRQQSPRIVCANFAYLLQESAKGYLIKLEEKVGMKPPPLHQATTTPLHSGSAFDELDPDEPPSPEDQQPDVFPDFVPAALAAAIPLARRSIRILESSEIPIDLTRLAGGSTCLWFWGQSVSSATGNVASPRPCTQPAVSATRSYEPELAGLVIFDLEPGSAETVLPDRPDFRHLDAFIDAFPSTTALVTPTLRFTAEATLQPVLDHTRMLSRQLLLLFLQSSNVHGHLCILRDYLLAANHSFKDLLVNALCSTAIQSNAVQQANKFMQIRRRTVHVRQKKLEEEQAFHGVGLSLGGYNIAHTDWPPGAADISFSLRRVIVDSLDASGQTPDEDGNALPAQLERGGVVWSEAEARLGFGLRDIPNDAVTEGWFNQDELEALDFLYLTYRPPQPLDQVMLSADIMSKYQRCFAFLLRLFRVEQVARLIHQHANVRPCATNDSLFSILPPARALLSRFSFQIQAFVTAFSTYICDIAIGRPFDHFLSSLERLRLHVLEAGEGSSQGLKTALDVFTLAQIHSDVMDSILASCLLRSKQGAVSDALCDSMRVILHLGRLVVRTTLKEVPEIQASAEMEELHSNFERCIGRFITLLGVLVVKMQRKGGKVADRTSLSDDFAEDVDNEPPLAQLLLRMDAGGWWKRAAVAGSKRRAREAVAS